jgi:nucleoside-diphosphate-sugar epimerase
MPIISLRFSGIYTEEHRAMLAKRKGDPLIRGTGALWSYIDARDAARAVRLALEANLEGHQAINIAAGSNLVGLPIRELAERYLGAVTERRAGLNGSGSGYSVAKAKNLLGFEGKISLVD